MLASCDLISFAATTDPAKAKPFYGDVLGLPLTAEEPSALVFDVNSRILRVSIVKELAPAPYAILGWRVPDIRGTIRVLMERGVSFERFDGFEQDDLGIWTAPDGTRVAWFKDPDGNLLSVTQFPGSP